MVCLPPKGGTYIDRWVNLYKDSCRRVLPSIYCAKASRPQLPDIALRSDTQALRLIASIPLIQRKGKCHSREEKNAFM